MHYSNTSNPVDFPVPQRKRKRKITTRVIFDGAVDKTYTQMRQVYTDDKGEYVNCNRNRYYIENDSFDIVYTTGRAFTFAEVLKDLI